MRESRRKSFESGGRCGVVRTPSATPAGSGPAAETESVSATREGFAAALIACRERLRARIVRQARRAGIAIDAEDVLGSVFRRLDLAMIRGVVRASSENQFWAFAAALTDHLVLNRLRGIRRERGAMEAWGREASARFERCRDNGEAAALVHEMLMSLEHQGDRELMYGRMCRESFAAIAQREGRSEAALRQRWGVIRRRLRERFEAEGMAESGERRAESGERRAESGERRAESGERRDSTG